MIIICSKEGTLLKIVESITFQRVEYGGSHITLHSATEPSRMVLSILEGLDREIKLTG